MAGTCSFGQTNFTDIFYFIFSLLVSLHLGSCSSQPLFYCLHGNRQKMEDSEIAKKLWVHLIQIFRGSGRKRSVFRGKNGPQSPHFQISMATVQNFKIPTPLRHSLTPTDCPGPILLLKIGRETAK